MHAYRLRELTFVCRNDAYCNSSRSTMHRRGMQVIHHSGSNHIVCSNHPVQSQGNHAISTTQLHQARSYSVIVVTVQIGPATVVLPAIPSPARF